MKSGHGGRSTAVPPSPEYINRKGNPTLLSYLLYHWKIYEEWDGDAIRLFLRISIHIFQYSSHHYGGTMKMSAFFNFFFIAFFIVIAVSSIMAQSIDQRLHYSPLDYARGYVQPVVDAFGANLNSGLYHSADTEGELEIYGGIKIIGTFITSDMQTFKATSPYNGQTSSTATIVGGSGADIPGAPPGTPSKYLDGASSFSSVKIVPLFVPQASVGNFKGTQLMIRFLPTQNISGVGKVSFWGFGIQHSLSQYIPLLPLHLAAQGTYQKLMAGDNFDATAYSIGIQASKKIAIVSVYGGVAYEHCSVTLSYEYTNPSLQSQKYSVDFTGANTVRATIGACVNFLFFTINADYSLGKIPVGCVGIGVDL